MTDNLSPFLTVREFSERYHWPEGGLRHLIFFDPNHFNARVISRIGRKVLINVAAFWTWIGEQKSAGGKEYVCR